MGHLGVFQEAKFKLSYSRQTEGALCKNDTFEKTRAQRETETNWFSSIDQIYFYIFKKEVPTLYLLWEGSFLR